MASEEINISELELREELAGDLVFPVESSTDTNSTTLSALKDWLKTYFVGMTEDEEIAGIKRFLSTIRQQAGIPYTSAPAETTYNGLAVQDSNKSTWASFEGVQYASGTNAVQMTVRGNSGTLRRMYVQENSSGAVTYGYGQTSGGKYIKIPKDAGTSVLICWGNISSSAMATSKTITYPTAFSEAPRIALTSNGGSAQVYQNVIKDGSSTSFTAIASGGSASQGFHWIAVGNANL